MHQDKTNSLTYMIMIICDFIRGVGYYRLIVKVCEIKMLNQDSNMNGKRGGEKPWKTKGKCCSLI
jgi:hypothetical protein